MRLALLVSAASCLAAGCDGGDAPSAPSAGAGPSASPPVAESPPTPASPESARERAREVFATRCSTCHGPAGAGDGPAAAGLVPKPRNFQDSAWQASVTDEHIERIILEGGAAVGLSPLMPPNPDFAGRSELVAALRERVRGLAAQ